MLAELAAGATVVTATARQARHLRWQFDRWQAAAGRATWPAPHIEPLAGWLESSWESSLLAGGHAGTHLLLTDVQAGQLWREIVEADGDILGAGSAAGLAARSWRLLWDWGLTVAELRNCASPESDAATFARWAGRFAAQCREHGWLDAAALPAALARDIDAGTMPCPGRIWFSGFEPWPPRLEALRLRLSARGCDARVAALSSRVSSARAAAFADDASERAAMAGWAAASMRAGEARSIALILADAGAGDALRRDLLERAAPGWRLQEPGLCPVVTEQGTPLADHGLVRAALLILALPAGHASYRDVGQLLRSPYLAGHEAEAAGRAALDLRNRDRGQWDVDLWALAGAGADAAPIFAAGLRRVLELGRGASGRRPAAEWVAWVDQLLSAMGWARGRPLDEYEQKITEQLQSVIEDFSTCSGIWTPLSAAGVRARLARLASDRDAPGSGDEAGVRILSLAEAAGRAFDAVWIGGLTAEAWPPRAAPDPLLPIALQRRAGIPASSTTAWLDLANARMRGLLGCAPEVLCSYPERRGAEARVPSPVLAGLPPAAGIAGDGGCPPFRDQVMWSGEIEVCTRDPAPALPSEERVRGGSRVLELQAACPARAFFEVRLGARELAVPPLAIGGLLRGQLAHAVLERLAVTLARDQLAMTDPAVAGIAATIIDAVLAERLPRRHPLTPTVTRLEADRLSALVAELQALESARPAFRILAAERQADAQVGPLSLQLRLDRLDELADGQQLVIDYKTGQRQPSLSDWRGERPVAPQLPLYACVAPVSGAALVWLAPGRVRYIGVAASDTGIPGLSTPARLARDDAVDWVALTELWRESLTRLAEEFAAGSVRIDRQNYGLAAGQFAMLTRLHESPGLEEPGA